MKTLGFIALVALARARPAPPCDTDPAWQNATVAASLRTLAGKGYSLVNTPTKRFIKGSAFGNNPSR